MKNICYWCGKEIEKQNIDHIIPKWVHGSNTENNKIATCNICNSQKSNNIWIKDKNDKILKFKHPKQYVKIIKGKKKHKIVISTVYIQRIPYDTAKLKDYKEFGRELNKNRNELILENLIDDSVINEELKDYPK